MRQKCSCGGELFADADVDRDITYYVCSKCKKVYGG
jgi:hypothetical protein